MDGLSLRQIERRFVGGGGVRDITLDVRRGELVALIGPSGAGKSTLLRLIAGLDAPTRGTILWDGRDITRAAPADRRVGVTFDDGALYEHLTVRGNLLAGLERFGIAGPNADTAVRDAAALMGATHLLERKPETLSAGERRRVALGRAIARRPAMLLLDEPLTHLDDRTRHDLREDLANAHRAIGAATVIVTHDHDDALAIADRLVFLDGGRVLQSGTAAEFERPDHVAVARGCSWRPLNVLPDGTRTIAFAAESVRVTATPPTSGWSASGRVSHVSAMGAPVVTVRIESGERVRLRWAAAEVPPALGQALGLHVPPESIQTFGPDGDRREDGS